MSIDMAAIDLFLRIHRNLGLIGRPVLMMYVCFLFVISEVS